MSALPLPLLVESDAGAGRIRPFRREDVPAVVALRRQLFKTSERRTVARLAEYFERLFLGASPREDALPSLVYEDEAGSVAGFLGCVPRRMSFRGRRLRVAVGTQLMVAPQHRGLAGRRLARAFTSGPQDLTLSDLANDAARRLGASVGMRAIPAYSLTWTLPVRRARAALAHHARGPFSRAAAMLARPLCAAWDAATAPEAPTAEPGDAIEPFDAERHLPDLERLLAQWSLHPAYDGHTMAWLREQIEQKPLCSGGALQHVVVRDGQGRVLGMCLYCANAGGTAPVLQLVVRSGEYARVLRQLVRHARARGVVALSGRLDPPAAHELASAGCGFAAEGPWLLAGSRDPEVLDAIVRGDAFLSRLDGEWWLSF